MATQFGENMLPKSAVDWVLTNATISSAGLQLLAGGVAYTEITSMSDINVVPEALCVCVKAAQYDNKYKPSAFVHIQITFIDDNTFDALVPIINNVDGNKAILYPTISKYDIDVSAFKRIRFTVKSKEALLLTEYSLQKSLNDVVREDCSYYGVTLSQREGLTVTRSTSAGTRLGLMNLVNEQFIEPYGNGLMRGGAAVANGSSQLEYIENNGTGAFFKTGIIPTADTVIEFDGYVIDGNTALYGSRRNTLLASNSWYCIQFTEEGVYRLGFIDAQLAASATYTAGVRHTFRQEGNLLYIDGTYIGSAESPLSVFTTAHEIYAVGAMNTGGMASNFGMVRMYRMKVWQKGTLVADFVPWSITVEASQSEAVFNSDILSMRAMVDGVMKDCIYFDTTAQRYRLSGDVLIDGSLQSDATMTDALYAEQGDVAQLTVDWIDTGKRIYKYLKKDTSPDFHFVGHTTTIQFIASTVIMEDDVPLTEQLYNRYGMPLYWQKDITDASIVNGYPYIDDLRVYTTTNNTGFPVIVYRYKDGIMREITFKQDPDTGYWFPTDIYGQGTDDMHINGRGKILKTTDSFELSYTTSSGTVTGVYMRNDGFVDVIHRRAGIRIDTTNKNIEVTPEGELADTFIIGYAENGNELTLTWPDGKSFKVVKD